MVPKYGVDGVFNINKPAGWTSQDVCAKLRNLLKIKKAGHTGTLDPMAEGVLPVCTGSATRFIEYYDRDIKKYHASMKLGIASDTLDITGKITETLPFSYVSEAAVREAFDSYKGEVSQMPPRYSAVKINGRRAYELAREGKEFDVKPRKIRVFDNEITELDLDKGIIEFDVSCSKGTYIRSICGDIGRTLGCGAVMTALVRISTGCFDISNSTDIRELASMTEEEIRSLVIPVDETLALLGKLELRGRAAGAFLNGRRPSEGEFLITKETEFDDSYRVYGHANGENDGKKPRFLGVAEVADGTVIPKKVLCV